MELFDSGARAVAEGSAASSDLAAGHDRDVAGLVPGLAPPSSAPLGEKPSSAGRGRRPLRPSQVPVFGSPGQPLDASTREYMESRFGHGFSQVRVHTGQQAAASASAMGARAYTHGSDIAFAAGAYAPATGRGRRLLAHELAHVVQQGDASLPGDGPGVVEASADEAARRVAAGVPAGPVRARAGPGVWRSPADPAKEEEEPVPGFKSSFEEWQSQTAGPGNAPLSQALTPEEMYHQIVENLRSVRGRSWRLAGSAPKGPLQVDPRGKGKAVGYPIQTGAAVQVLDANGKRVALAYGVFQGMREEQVGGGEWHGEERAAKALERLNLSPVPGGSMIVVIETDAVCGPRCKPALEKIGTKLELTGYDAFAPTRQSAGPGGGAVKEKTAAMTSTKGGMPPTSVVRIDQVRFTGGGGGSSSAAGGAAGATPPPEPTPTARSEPAPAAEPQTSPARGPASAAEAGGKVPVGGEVPVELESGPPERVTKEVVGTPDMTPVEVSGPSATGDAMFNAGVVALQALGWYLEQKNRELQYARMNAALDALEPSIRTHQRLHPEDGALISLRFTQAAGSPDSPIQPGPVFAGAQASYGPTVPLARDDLASTPSIRAGLPPGTQEHIFNLWVKPRKPLAAPPVPALPEGFTAVAAATFVSSKAVFQNVVWYNRDGFDDKDQITVDIPEGVTLKFYILRPPTKLSGHNDAGRVSENEVPQLARQAGSGETIPVVDLDPTLRKVGFNATAAVLYPADDITRTFFDMAPATEFGNMILVAHFAYVRWSRPENLRLIAP
jgi:Domain of unknown function (DUF4157)